MTKYEQLQSELRKHPRTWLITGVAGFIGSNLLEKLLSLQQRVVGLDNFSTGKRENLAEVQASVGSDAWQRFTFIEGDICRLEDCRKACANVDMVLHQAALGSVPRSIDDPQSSHHNNVDGFVNMLLAARDARVKRFVYASSSSVYGDSPSLPKIESMIGRPLSPYAATKFINEIYADVFHRCYGLQVTGLRYFNVFGPRQDPAGAYAAVIPRWFAAAKGGETIVINGDGETSRDFCYVENVMQANILAATSQAEGSPVFNVAVGQRTTLNQLAENILSLCGPTGSKVVKVAPRAGDIRHSLADVSQAVDLLGYAPTHTLADGLAIARAWYCK